MYMFTVLLKERNSSFEETIERHYPGVFHYKLNDCVYFIKSDELTSDISKKLGISAEGGITGVVLRQTPARAGWADPSVWEWIILAESKINAWHREFE